MISQITLYLRYRSNMNSFDMVLFFSLLPRRNAEKIESLDRAINETVNPNLHLYRLHAINENIKSIFVRIKERKTRSRNTHYHVWCFIAMLWKNQSCKTTWRVTSRARVRLAWMRISIISQAHTQLHIIAHIYSPRYLTFKTKFKAKIYIIELIKYNISFTCNIFL